MSRLDRVMVLAALLGGCGSDGSASGDGCDDPLVAAPFDRAGILATSCSGAARLGVLELYELVANDLDAVVAFDARADVAAASSAVVSEASFFADCAVQAALAAGTADAGWECALTALGADVISSSSEDCSVLLGFDHALRYADVAAVIEAQVGVQRVVPATAGDDCQSTARLAFVGEDRFYEIGADDGECSPTVYTYRVSGSVVELTSEECLFPTSGNCDLGTGPAPTGATEPGTWACDPLAP